MLVVMLAMFWAVVPRGLAQPGSGGSGGTPRGTIIFWTDGPRLKAVNIAFFPDHNGPVGIISVPLHACLGQDTHSLTVAEYYLKHGRVKLTRRLEQLFKAPIETYISIDQETLYHASAITGKFRMADVQTSLAGVFEGRYVDHPLNLQVEIRQLAEAVTTPAMLVKLPQVIWVVATQVDTNLGPEQFLNFYQLLKNSGPEVLQKKAVPGHDYRVGEYKFRRVKPEAWPGTLREVTTRS